MGEYFIFYNNLHALSLDNKFLVYGLMLFLMTCV